MEDQLASSFVSRSLLRLAVPVRSRSLVWDFLLVGAAAEAFSAASLSHSGLSRPVILLALTQSCIHLF